MGWESDRGGGVMGGEEERYEGGEEGDGRWGGEGESWEVGRRVKRGGEGGHYLLSQ